MSQFNFSRHLRDIENSNKSPHSNCSTHSTPSKKTPHSTSVSPHTSTPNKSITISHYKPPSALKILIPEHPNILARDSYPTNIESQNSNTNTKSPKNPTIIKSSHLTIPPDSDTNFFSSPLLSEPSPNPASPIPLTLQGNRSSISNKSSNKSDSTNNQEQEQQEQEIEREEQEILDTVYNYPSSSIYNTQFTNYNSHTSYTTNTYSNQSPVSTTSTYCDNLTPLYRAQILELTQSTTVPDLCLAPLDFIASPTPFENKLNSLQIIPTPPKYKHNNNNNKFTLHKLNLNLTKSKGNYLKEATQNYNYLSDSDYSYNSDFDNNLIEKDIQFENQLIEMGCCCNKTHNDNNDNNDNNLTMPLSFTDKYFRSKADIKKHNNNENNINDQKTQEHGHKDINNKDQHPHHHHTEHSMDDDYPPVPMPNDHNVTNDDVVLSSIHNYNSSKNLTLLSSHQSQQDLNKLEEQTDTRTYNTLEEQKDIVSPIMPALDKINSIGTAKRPSTSQLSSPLHSVRLSITPKGHLAPIHIMDHSDDEEDNSLSTTDSKEDREHTKYSQINTPVEFLKKHDTITKFVSSHHSQNSSQQNVLSRKKRRGGVSERHTLTFSKPPIPPHELPQSPKFTEITLDVMKPVDFLHKILRGNLLFSGMDPEFSDKMVTKVVDLMRAADFEQDEILIHQGAEGDAFYAIEYGKFDILVTDKETCIQKKVAESLKGECVGEYALLYNQPRTATLKAIDTSRVWGITAEQFANMRQEIMDWNVERFERRQKFIHSIALFQQLEQHELLNMTHACHAEIYDINEYIIKPNEINTNVYIIMEGTIIISYDNNMKETEFSSNSMNNNQMGLQLQLKMSSSNDNIGGGKETHDNNNETLTLNLNLNDPPIMEDIDHDESGGITINLKEQRTTNNNNNNATNNQSAFPLSLSALNSVNSLQSVHSIVQLQNSSNRLINLQLNNGCIGGDKELGCSDYFAQNLFVNQYEDYDEEEIISARAHTKVKVLKIARDDFVLIMASGMNMNGVMNSHIMNMDGMDPQGYLPDNKVWKNKLIGKDECQLSDLREIDVLGIGSFGKVTLVEHMTNKQTYALKCVSKYRVVKTGQEEHIINEKRVLTMLDSPFCVKLFATFKTDYNIYFLTNVVLGGELFTVLRYNEKFDKNATRFYAGCVILALEHLHSMDIIYRDLKPENLLLNNRGYLQLTDFGFAKRRNTTCTLCGTPQYLAPEVIHNWVQSFATDWWALGVLLYEMVVGHPPFEDDENIKMYEKILVHEPEFPKDINSKLRHLIQKLLEKNAYQRLGSGAGGAKSVKLHPFFKNKLLWQDLYEQKLDPPYKPNIASRLDTSNFDRFSDYEESDDDENNIDENQGGGIDVNSPHFKWVQQF